MEEVKGYVEHIVFRNEDNGYTVFDLNNEDGELTWPATPDLSDHDPAHWQYGG